jgi:hypothetical protein
MSQKAQERKAKINKLAFIKLKGFYIAKEAINKVKRQSTEWEKLLANHSSDKGSISKNNVRNSYNSIVD